MVVKQAMLALARRLGAVGEWPNDTDSLNKKRRAEARLSML
jgi:hypothetical protein